jgi:hypothetical protein
MSSVRSSFAREMAHKAQDRWLNGPGGHAEALEAVEAVVSEVLETCARDAQAERDGLAATVRVHEFTIRKVSTARDQAMAERDRLKVVLEVCGWRHFDDGAVEKCGVCDLTPQDCDRKNRNLSIDQCRGYVARRALAHGQEI